MTRSEPTEILAGELRDGIWRVTLIRAVQAGEVVHQMTGEVFENPTKYTVKVGPRDHIMDPVARYMNHSCTPTCAIDGLEITALQDLAAGDEVTFDYTSTEEDFVSQFGCNECGLLLTGAPVPCGKQA